MALVPKDKIEGEMKMGGGGTCMCYSLFSPLNLQGAPQEPLSNLLPAQRGSMLASALGELNTSQGAGIGFAGCAVPEGPGISQRSLGRRYN